MGIFFCTVSICEIIALVLIPLLLLPILNTFYVVISRSH